MRRSNCSAPIPPPGHPRGHHFFCCFPGVLITLIFTCPALYNHQNHPFFECPALFYHTHIFSDPGAARGGDGARTIWPAQYAVKQSCLGRTLAPYWSFSLKYDAILVQNYSVKYIYEEKTIRLKVVDIRINVIGILSDF